MSLRPDSAGVERRLRLSFFASAHVSEATTWEGTWAELVARLREHGRTLQGKNGAALCGAHFEEGEGRTKTTRGKLGRFRQRHLVAHIDVLGFDFDVDVPDDWRDAVRAMPFGGLAYSTHSHGRPGKGARYRVLWPLQRSVTPDEYGTLWRYVNEQLGGKADQSCSDTTRLLYTPRRKAEDAEREPFIVEIPGDTLNPDALPLGLSVAALLEAERRAGLGRGKQAELSDADCEAVRGAWQALRGEARNAALAVAHAGCLAAVRSVETAKERRNALFGGGFTVGAYLAAGALTRSQAEDYRARLLQVTAARFSGELSERKLAAHVDNGMAYGERRPASLPVGMLRGLSEKTLEPPAEVTAGFALTDTGNAERFAALNREDVRYTPQTGTWHVWTGRTWEEDRGGAEVEARTKATVRSIHREAALETDDAQRAAIGKWAVTSEKAERRRAVVVLARSERALRAAVQDFDADPMLMNLENGTLDLRTAKLLPHRRQDMITRIAPVAFDEGARAPTFEAFVTEILPEREVRAFVQRFLGSALTAEVREHVLPVFYGAGSNGKSVLLEAVKSVLGPYAGTVPAELLMARKFEAHPAERMTLRGKRLAIASETEQNRRLAESTVKQLTGGDTITARGMRQDFVEFKPTHKLVLTTNHKPRLIGTDNGIRRRVRLVPFVIVIPTEKQDTQLPAKLAAEAPGILCWLLEGCRAWQRDGLGMPGAIAEATQDYFAEEDVVGHFLEDRCVRDPEARARVSDVFAAFCEWARANGQPPLSRRAFGDALAEKAIVSRKSTGGSRVYLGVRLAPQSGVSGASGVDSASNAYEAKQEGEPEKCATRATRATCDDAEDLAEAIWGHQ
jgi:P4 family phage/plasmid primase-like protien